jgi:hypothetical protein
MLTTCSEQLAWWWPNRWCRWELIDRELLVIPYVRENENVVPAFRIRMSVFGTVPVRANRRSRNLNQRRFSRQYCDHNSRCYAQPAHAKSSGFLALNNVEDQFSFRDSGILADPTLRKED